MGRCIVWHMRRLARAHVGTRMIIMFLSMNTRDAHVWFQRHARYGFENADYGGHTSSRWYEALYGKTPITDEQGKSDNDKAICCATTAWPCSWLSSTICNRLMRFLSFEGQEIRALLEIGWSEWMKVDIGHYIAVNNSKLGNNCKVVALKSYPNWPLLFSLLFLLSSLFVSLP